MTTELLKKYIEGDASQKEREEVQLWLEADEKNYKEFISLRILYDITLGSLPEKPDFTSSSGKRKRKRILTGFVQIAASILITFGCTYYFLMNAPQEEEAITMQTLHIPAGQRAELTLADGTKVWLNALTTLTFPNRFTETSREVYLDGEAYFDVAHNTGSMFTVNTNDHLVHALGTEFNVTAYTKNSFFETSLLEGSVEVVSKADEQKIVLDPGNRAYLKSGKLVSSPIRDYDHFLWTKGILSFNHERMEDILEKLELYYDVEIQNNNPKTNDMRYTGKFRIKDGIEHVLNVLRIPTGMRYVKDNEMNVIYIK